MIDHPGVYDIPEAAYHADPCVAPSLSSSIARIILARSPWHAWAEHPRLGNLIPEEEDRFNLGKAAHTVMLGGPAKCAVIAAESWRTKEAKEFREDAYKRGLIPLLETQWNGVEAMVTAGRRQLLDHEEAGGAFMAGKPEQMLAWQEEGIWCRALLDWLPDGGEIFDDYKTTAASAHPDAWTRTAYGFGADVQAAFYRRGIRAVLGIENPQFRFVVQETKPPYALSVIALTPASLDMADRKVKAAINLWGWSLQAGKWPGYPTRTCYVDAPGYEETRWLEQEAREDENHGF